LTGEGSEPAGSGVQAYKERMDAKRAALRQEGTPEPPEMEAAYDSAMYQHVLFLSTIAGCMAQAPLQLQHLQRCVCAHVPVLPAKSGCPICRLSQHMAC
jgi:hypothetical protein